ncbi:MAG: hypothetical protein H0V30_08455 [Chitinophagaceae bacterium]|jgi:hypothetical protein|nr:hypothetical protein [Chitinophagaceae bacterium]
MQNKPSYSIADFSPQLFWDVDRNKLDLEKNKRFVIERVLQRGSRKDFNMLLGYFGKERIKEVVKQLPWLNEKDQAFVHVFFDIPYNDLKCYIRKPLSRHF